MTENQKGLYLMYSKIKNKLSYRNLPNIFELPCAIIKGEVLSVLAYKTEGKRICRDIDILIPRKRLKDVKKILLANEFNTKINSREDELMMLSSSHQTPPFYREISPIEFTIIDLNFDVFWGEYEGRRIDIEDFLSDTIEIEIYGVKVKTLPPIKAMIQLVLHHYKDMNSIYLLATRRCINHDMLKDVYYLLKNNLDTISLDKLYELSETYGIIPYVYCVLYYTGLIFEDSILKQYIDAFRTLEGEVLLNNYGLCTMERKEWRCDAKTRLESDNLYSFIEKDLTDKDIKKIEINKRVFGGN